MFFALLETMRQPNQEKKAYEHKLDAKAVVSMYFVFVWVVSFHPKNTKQNFGPIGVTVYSQGPF